jgi:ubiquinone biosynthesis protein
VLFAAFSHYTQPVKTPFSGIGRTYRHMLRYRELIGILIKYGFQDIVEQLNLRYYLERGKSVFRQEPEKDIEIRPRAERFRLMLEEMGTTFIKFGQIISTRRDIVPEDILIELEKLQDKVPPFPDEEARKCIEEEFETEIGSIFSEFGERPIASASIAQVYKATLPDGTEVAVKVKRPGIEKRVAIDVEIMLSLARLAEEYLEGAGTLQLVNVVEEFSRTIENEMNFHIEAHSMERFAENFKKWDTLHTIKVFRELSTRTILTAEYIHGIKISQLEELAAANVDAPKVARTGAKALLAQVFEHGFFHGDPHPGNLMVVADSRVCFLDFGMMGRLDRQGRENLASLLVSVVNRDDDMLTRATLKIAMNPDEITDRAKLKRELSRFIDAYAYLPLNKIDAGEVLNDLLDLLLGFGIRLPPEFYLLIKALVTIEGVGTMLDPHFEFLEFAKPYVAKIIRRRHDPRRLLDDLRLTSVDFYRVTQEIPDALRSLFTLIRKGEIKLNLQTQSLQPVTDTWDRDANRLALAIVTAAVLVSSSLIISARIPPLWGEMSIVGIIGFGLSIVMTIRLLLAFFRSGHL